MSACLTVETLARIAEGDLYVDARDQQHAAECESCARNIAFLRECLATGLDDIQEEAADVDALMAEFWTEHLRRYWRIVPDPRFHREPFVRRLLALALHSHATDTRLALSYSKAATELVEVMARERPLLANLRFDAWRYHSTFLRELGDYETCREAFVKANVAAAETTDPELSRAIVLLARALLAIEPDVWEPEEGRDLLERAESVFARRGDPARLLSIKTTRGILARREGDPGAALAMFAQVLAETPRDSTGYADALGNYVWARIDAGMIDEDVALGLDLVERMDEERGAEINTLRDRGLRGLLYLSQGLFAEAVPLLRATARGFEAKGHIDTSIRVGLDTVRALLLAQRYEEADDLARDLAARAIGLDQRQPSRRRTLTAEAMAYAREAAQRQMLTPDLVASIAAYIDRITYQRPVDFVPPLPLNEM